MGAKTDTGVPTVYRPSDGFPAGESCPLSVEDLPDDEDEFGTTDHYEEMRSNRRDPAIDTRTVRELLTTGTVRQAENFTDRYLVQKEIDGYEWTVVVADDTNQDNLERNWGLITIYSNYHGSVGTTNRYFDRLRERRQSNEEDGSPEDDELRERRQSNEEDGSPEDDELRDRRRSGATGAGDD